MFNKYYQDELAYLRELGREFAEHNPESAGWLAQPGVDPDVERLLEGFAFLTGRIRQKLDDELPELTHALLQLFWPHYLRPLPSMTTIELKAKPKAAAKVQQCPRGSELGSQPVDETRCTFRTAYETTVWPLKVDALEVGSSSDPYLRLTLALNRGAAIGKLELTTLRLHFTGATAASRGLYFALARYLGSGRAHAGGTSVELPQLRARPVGFAEDEALLPTPKASYPGFRLLQEYFLFPEKFMYLDLEGLEPLAKLGNEGQVELELRLSSLPHDLPPVTAKEVRVNCTPAVNLFRHDADPIRLSRERVEYPIRPAGQAAHYEVFSIDSVQGIRRADPTPRIYRPFYAFERVDEGGLLFQTRVARALTTRGTDHYMTFLEDGLPPAFGDETISIDLTCSNRHLPTSLGLGDVNEPTPRTPGTLAFANITRPTAPVRPPLEGDLFWSLLSHLSLNYLSLLTPESLRKLLQLYDFRARVDRQAERALGRRLEGILAVQSEPSLRVLRGATIRGVTTTLTLDEDRFGGEGEAYLFGSVMDAFLAQYVTLNAYSQVKVHGKKYGEVHQWPAKTGARTIL